MAHQFAVRLGCTFGPRSLSCLLAAGMIAAIAPELASESVTLNTYYPAPSGAYAQLITTGNAFLSRDGGGVSIGASTPASSGTKLAVMNGNVGIGTLTPGATLEVDGTVKLPSGAHDGYVLTSDVSGNAAWQPAHGFTHLLIVNSPRVSNLSPQTPLVSCPSGYHLVSCVVIAKNLALGPGFLLRDVVYVDASGHATLSDPVGCQSAAFPVPSEYSQTTQATCAQ